MKLAHYINFGGPTGLGLDVAGTWADFEGLGRFEPCLVITNPNHPAPEEPCVVKMSDAWRWNGILGDPHATAIEAYDFALRLGLEAAVGDVRAVYDVVRANIDQLVKMPPYRKDA